MTRSLVSSSNSSTRRCDSAKLLLQGEEILTHLHDGRGQIPTLTKLEHDMTVAHELADHVPIEIVVKRRKCRNGGRLFGLLHPIG